MEGGVRRGIKITVSGREAGMNAEKEAANVDQRNRSGTLVGCHGHIRAMGCRASTFHQRCKDHRQPVIDSWSLIYSVDSNQLINCIRYVFFTSRPKERFLTVTTMAIQDKSKEFKLQGLTNWANEQRTTLYP
uniref:Uncharacterized protein n=1 Tax=Parascaris equorum TaxID=6256 RepID=A0A914R9F0_PAREQ